LFKKGIGERTLIVGMFKNVIVIWNRFVLVLGDQGWKVVIGYVKMAIQELNAKVVISMVSIPETTKATTRNQINVWNVQSWVQKTNWKIG